MSAYRIVVLGGAGLFGSRIVHALARDAGFEIVVAGRRIDAAQSVANAARGHAQATVLATSIDIEAPGFAARLAELRPDCVIHTAGPFQQRDYAVARAALTARAHCIDLADGRAFVTGIGELDAEARAAGRWVISGASSVPGLSAAVIAAHLPRFAELTAVDSAISPGNRTDRGLATTQAILGYVGQPVPTWIERRWQRARGWSSLRRMHDSETGTRWLARCDVPDLSLLPARYPSLRSCEFRAGLELRRMHFGLWLLGGAVRLGLVRDAAALAPSLLALSNRWRMQGSDVGLMRMDLRGVGVDARPLHLRWTLIARNGDGLQVPATPAVVLARKLAAGALPGGGARACLDFFTLAECIDALAPWTISTRTDVLKR